MAKRYCIILFFLLVLIPFTMPFLEKDFVVAQESPKDGKSFTFWNMIQKADWKAALYNSLNTNYLQFAGFTVIFIFLAAVVSVVLFIVFLKREKVISIIYTHLILGAGSFILGILGCYLEYESIYDVIAPMQDISNYSKELDHGSMIAVIPVILGMVVLILNLLFLALRLIATKKKNM